MSYNNPNSRFRVGLDVLAERGVAEDPEVFRVRYDDDEETRDDDPDTGHVERRVPSADVVLKCTWKRKRRFILTKSEKNVDVMVKDGTDGRLLRLKT